MSALLAEATPLNQLPSLLVPAYEQTLEMVGLTVVAVVILGTPLALLLYNTGPGGLIPHKQAHSSLGWIVNLGRSLPFLILMAAIIPFTQFVTGTTIGIYAAVVPMIVAGTPFTARLMENSLRDVPISVTEVGRASGGSAFQVIRTAQLSEAWPGIVGAITITTIGMIEYSAIAGTIGAGGIGYVAVIYGYDRFDNHVMLACILILVLTVALVQFIGDRIPRHATPH